MVEKEGVRLGKVSWIGSTEISAPIAAGRTAVVLDGFHHDHGKPVAIKVITHPEYTQQKFEADVDLHQSIADIPGVVPLLDYGVAHLDNDTRMPTVPFMVLEKAKGGSVLDAVRATGGLGEQIAVDVVGQVATTLDTMHTTKGIVHGDPQPSNYLLRKQVGEEQNSSAHTVWVADFDTSGPPTNPGEKRPGVCLPYAAPERTSKQALPQSDQYSVAAAFPEIAWGKRIIPVTQLGAYRQKVLSRNYHSYLVARTEAVVPEPFRGPIRRAMHQDPRRRYGTITEFVEEVTSIAKGVSDRTVWGSVLLDNGRRR